MSGSIYIIKQMTAHSSLCVIYVDHFKNIHKCFLVFSLCWFFLYIGVWVFFLVFYIFLKRFLFIFFLFISVPALFKPL